MRLNNNIQLLGRLTADPELKTTPSGLEVVQFTVAIDRPKAKDATEKQTDFIPCVAWEKTGEFVDSYFTKGKLALVSGRLQIRSYTDKEGRKRTATEVIADRVYFGEKKETKPEQPASFDQIFDDDDALPFA